MQSSALDQLSDAAIVERLIAATEVAIHVAQEAGLGPEEPLVAMLRQRRRELTQSWLAPTDQLGLPW